MLLLRLAYATLFLIALIAVFVLWSQVGGQSHLDYMAWQWKLLLGGGAAFAAVKATAASVAGERAWNGKTLRWLGILVMLLAACGVASYYVHMYVEPDDDAQQDDSAAGGARGGFEIESWLSIYICGAFPAPSARSTETRTRRHGSARSSVFRSWDNARLPRPS
jgi:hypothetical protein